MDSQDPVKFWKQDPKVLWDPEKFKEFVPTESMSFNQKLNAMTRFLIYFSTLLYIIYGRPEALFLLLVGLALVYVMYDYKIDVNVVLKNKKEEAQREQGVIREGFSTTSPPRPQQQPQQQQSQSRPSKVDQIVQNIQQMAGGGSKQADSLLPPDLFNSQTQSKYTTDGLNFRYTVGDNQNQNQNGGQSTSNKEANVPEGATDRSNIIPFSASGLASVDAVTDAFTNAPNTNPFQSQGGYPQQSGGGADCSKCAPANSPYSPPTCEKGVASALDANANMCQMPTPDNPFMNLQVTDYANNPNRLPACNPEIVKNDINNMWSQNLYRNANDVWDKNNNQMRFNTESWTTNPNDRDAFQKWLYHIPYVCKDGDLGACYRGSELQQGNLRPGKIF